MSPTIEQVQQQFTAFNQAVKKFISDPVLGQAFAVVWTGGHFAYPLIEDRGDERFVTDLEEICNWSYERRDRFGREAWNTALLGDEDRWMLVPEPPLRPSFVQYYAWNSAWMAPEKWKRHPMNRLGRYVLGLFAFAPLQHEGIDRTGQLAKNLARIADRVSRENLGEFLGLITQEASDLHWSWRRGVDADFPTDATTEERRPGYYRNAEQIPDSFYKKAWLEGRKIELSLALGAKKRSQKTVDSRAKSGHLAVVPLGGQQWQIYFRSEAAFESAKRRYEKLSEPKQPSFSSGKPAESGPN